MTTLAEGEQVVVLSTEGGPDNHTHNVTVEREGADVREPADIDGTIDEFARHPKKKKAVTP